MLKFGYFVIFFCCLLPTIIGLIGLMLTALGYIPALDMYKASFAGFKMVFAWQGVEQSLALTFFSALISTYLAALISFAILQACWGRRFWQIIEASLSPLLAMPHVAFAIGFSFLFAPTGIGVRLWDNLFELSSSHASVTLATLIKDPYALGLILLLALKEVPFLLLMSMAILLQLDVAKLQKVSASLGYSRAQTWWKCILPQWLVKLRFPLLTVMAYGVSVVDVALILGPTNPPTFAVLVWQWFNDPDLALFSRAGAGAMVLFALSCVLIVLSRFIEWLICKGFRFWQYSGRTGWALPGKSAFVLLSTLMVLMIPIMLLWSFAQRWQFPDLLPSRYSVRFWQYEWGSVSEVIQQSVLIAIIAASIALLLALIAHEYRIRHRWQIPAILIALPLLIPQLSLLFGMQVASLYINSGAYFFWVCWGHVFFVFPYVYFSLEGPWQSFDNRYTRTALSLGKSPVMVWFKIKMPIMLSAIAFAWAIGISVSLAQYLPTLILGAGRISTMTTEAVALSSGYDRRVMAIYGIWLAFLPLIFFSIAFLIRYFQLKYRKNFCKGWFFNDVLPQKSNPMDS